MGTKLTLRMNEKLITNAKKIARTKGVSLSKLVSDYFQMVSSQQKKEMIESPILSEVAGILSSKADKRKLLKAYKKHIEGKYL
jgi:hypothetical protein